MLTAIVELLCLYQISELHLFALLFMPSYTELFCHGPLILSTVNPRISAWGAYFKFRRRQGAGLSNLLDKSRCDFDVQDPGYEKQNKRQYKE